MLFTTIYIQVSGCWPLPPFPLLVIFESVSRGSGAWAWRGGLPNVTRADATANPAACPGGV